MLNSRICGIDEAGRGALAGELAVCGCAFKDDCCSFYCRGAPE